MPPSDVMCRLGIFAASGTILLWAATGAAQSSQSCTASYETAKQREDAGRLLEARDDYANCAKKACGAFLLNECVTRHARLDTDIPAVVPFATGPSGAARTDVRVTMDGVHLVSQIDGRAVRIDPGMHEFVFRASDGATATEKVMVLEGDRNRRISVSLVPPKSEKAVAPRAAPAASAVEPNTAKQPAESTAQPEAAPQTVPTESKSKHIPAASWVLGGVGVLGVGSFVLLSMRGRHENQILAQSCGTTGSCSQSSVDQVQQTYTFANISLGVGIAAFGGAVLAYALSGPTRERPASDQAYALQVLPTHSGAVASVSGAF